MQFASFLFVSVTPGFAQLATRNSLMNIIALSIKRPSLVIVVFAILTLAGLFASRLMSYELLPNFNVPVVTIIAVYPGASPIEVETAVVKKVENIIAGVSGIKTLFAISNENYCVFKVELEDDADADLVENSIQKKITQNMEQFPKEMRPPNIGKFAFDDLPVMKLALYSDLPPVEFNELIKDKIEPALSRLDGVAQIRTLGGVSREIQVNLIRKKLETYTVSIYQVLEAVGRANVELPAGKIKSDDTQILVRFAGKITSLEQLKKVVVSTLPDGTVVKLEDIADIVDTNQDIEVLVRANGKEALGMTINKQADANAVDMSQEIREALTILERNYAEQNLKIDIIQDTSQFTLEAANGVFDDLLMAIILVAMVMFVFLKSIRNSLIIMLVVPISLVATLTVMYLLGYTYNLMSLLGLTLAVGTLVDDAIVVIENVYRHLEMGKNRIQAAYDATKELGLTLIATTLTLVMVFIPITLVGGLVTSLLTQFAMTIAIAVLFSTLVAFTIVPLLSSRVAKIEDFSSNPVLKIIIEFFDRIIDALSEGVTVLLGWALSHKLITLLVTGGLFALTVSLIPTGYIGIDFLAAGDRGEFLINLELPKEATLKETNYVAHQAEMIIKNRPEVQSVFTTIGIAGNNRDARNTPYLAEMNVLLNDKNFRDLPTDLIARQVKNELERNIIGAKIKPVSINILGFADRAPIQVLILGPDFDSLQVFANNLKKGLSNIEGVVELETSFEGGSSELNIQIDRQKIDDLGLSTAQVAIILRTALSGNVDNKFRDDQTDYDINIRLDAHDRKNLEDLMQLSFLTQKGERIYLYQFAEVTEKEGASELYRVNRTPTVVVEAQIVGRPFGDVSAEMVQEVEKLRLPEGAEIIYEGAQKREVQGFSNMKYAGIASILLLYFIMVALYDSFAYPFVVLITIPLAVIGAFLALGLSGDVISLFSITGMMMLIGLVAKNAILVVDFTVELQKRGMDLRDALVQATKIRLRPVLMTNVSMIIGLIPIGIATGAGAEWKNGLAWALIGGLTSSMFLSLVVVPIFYYLMETFLQKFGLNEKKTITIED